MCSIITMVRRGNSKETSKLETTHICCKQTDLRMCGHTRLPINFLVHFLHVCVEMVFPLILLFSHLYFVTTQSFQTFKRNAGVWVVTPFSYSPSGTVFLQGKPSRRPRLVLWLNRFGPKVLGGLSVSCQALNNRHQYPAP